MCNTLLLLIALASFYVLSDQTLNLIHAQNVKIVYPKVKGAIRKRRDIHNNKLVETLVKVVNVGDWILELSPDDNLVVVPDLKTEWVNFNDSKTLEGTKKCDYYKGVVNGLETSSVAVVTLCGHLMTAYVDVAGVPYLLEPLNETSGAHVLYTSKGIHSRLERSAFTASKLPVAKHWLFNLTGDVIDIQDDGEEMEFKSYSDEENDTSEEERGNIVITSGNKSSAEIPVPFQRQEWHREQTKDDEDGYFYDTAWTAKVQKARTPVGSVLPTRWLEIAVAVDHTLISFHGRNKVEQYVLALMNIVSAIYQDPSLEANMKIVITRLLMYEHKKHGIVRPGNAKKSLENVNHWNMRLHDSLQPGEPQHDVAVWLTRSDIGGPSGYAPVAGACDPKRSCALNRDEGLTSAFIIAHETAHILGLSHDGDKKNSNDCDDEALDGSIMAPMVSATFNKFSWSECSKREFRRSTNKWLCLLNPPARVGEILLNATLETSFTMDEQCRMEFGDGYYMCRAFEIIEPCSHLWCGHEKSPLVCKTKKGPPLEGTECGFAKWCVNGYCEEVGNKRVERVPIVLNPQDGAWGDWTPWGPCSRTCGTGVQFKSRKCNNPAPSFGGKYCTGEPEEWRACNLRQCTEPLVDVRAYQCKQLPKLLNLESKPETNFTWLPYESDQNNKKCKFICVNAERKQLYITDENLIDGTPCSYDNEDNICVQGKCHVIGCDGKVHSEIRRDRCGVCNGNNRECSENKFSFDRKLKREASRISVLPKMAREVKVEINVTVYYSDNPLIAFVLKNRRKKKYTITIPNTIIQTKIVDGVKFSYKKFSNRYKIWSKGPLQTEMVILVVVPKREISSGINISYTTEYSIHKDHLIPSKRFVWMIGGWGPCSVSCGGGRRQKTAACFDNKNRILVKRTYCSLLVKPKLDSEKCNTFGCNFQWTAGDWEPCTTSCGTKGVQQRELYCVPNAVLNTRQFEYNNTITYPWRYMVNPTKCSGTKPLAIRTCNRDPCISFWKFSDWSQCSTSCGSGMQIRSFYCAPPENENFFTCGKTPPFQKRTCLGNYTRHSNSLCKGKKKYQCKKDQSEYCSYSVLQKYCALTGFRRMCCKSCGSHNSLNDVVEMKSI